MQSTSQHILDIVKGLVAAMLTSALLAGLQYIGAHIPELIGLVTTSAAATGTIKALR